MVEEFLKFQGSFFALMQEQVSLSGHIRRVEQPAFFELRWGKRQVVGSCRFEILNRLRRVASPDFGVASDRRQPVVVEQRIGRKLLGQFFRLNLYAVYIPDTGQGHGGKDLCVSA